MSSKCVIKLPTYNCEVIFIVTKDVQKEAVKIYKKYEKSELPSLIEDLSSYLADVEQIELIKKELSKVTVDLNDFENAKRLYLNHLNGNPAIKNILEEVGAQQRAKALQ